MLTRLPGADIPVRHKYNHRGCTVYKRECSQVQVLFDELSAVTQKTNTLIDNEIDNGTKIKTGDRIRITITAYLDILSDSKPGTAFYTSPKVSIKVLDRE